MFSIEGLKQTLTPLAQELELDKVILFGSYARGEQTQFSDIDLIIDSGGRLQAFDIFCAIGKIQSQLPIRADIFELQEIKKPSETYSAILKDGVVIYERA